MDLKGFLSILVLLPRRVFLGEHCVAKRRAVHGAEFPERYADVHKLAEE
jgi:hypothetical protein